MATTPTFKKPAPTSPRKSLVSAEPKPHTSTIPVEPPKPVAPIAPAISVPPSTIEEPTPAKAAADAQAAQDAPKAPVKSPVKSPEEIPPIPNNANGEPLYTMFSWTRKLRREGKIKG